MIKQYCSNLCMPSQHLRLFSISAVPCFTGFSYTFAFSCLLHAVSVTKLTSVFPRMILACALSIVPTGAGKVQGLALFSKQNMVLLA